MGSNETIREYYTSKIFINVGVWECACDEEKKGSSNSYTLNKMCGLIEEKNVQQ